MALTGHAPKRIDTLIGAGMRIEGDIACNGVLRVQGDILGNVACDDGPNGMLVVDSAGSVTGAVNATHVSVMGRLAGPVRSSQSVEVHPGGSLVGDISFREIAIHAGGVVDGLLNPSFARPDDNSAGEPRPQVSAAPATRNLAMPAAADAGPIARRRGGRTLGVAIFLVVAVGAVVWMSRHRGVAPPADDVALKADAALNDTPAPKAPPVAAEAQSEPKAVDGDAPPLAPSLSVAAADPVQASTPDGTGSDQENVVAVRGANPRRPPGVFLLVCNEPTVLYRKKRGETGEGARIAVGDGEKVSVAIAPDELIRVAQGKDIVIFFQGQKVPRSAIESGAWMSFVPR